MSYVRVVGEFGETYIIPSERAGELPLIAEWLGDYAPDEDVSPDLVTAALLGADAATPDFAWMVTPRPALYFGDDLDDHVARLVDGTEEWGPILVVDAHTLASLPLYGQVEEMRVTVLHEMGHAYLRRRGVPYEWSEEDVVENFARHGGVHPLIAYGEAFGE